VEYLQNLYLRESQFSDKEIDSNREYSATEDTIWNNKRKISIPILILSFLVKSQHTTDDNMQKKEYTL